METLQFMLESAPDDVAGSMKPNERVRIVIIFAVEGYWRDKENAKDVATFNGSYRAMFSFAEEVDAEQLKSQMAEQNFRDFLAVQVYPLAKSHMFSQVAMLGINVNKRLGMDIYAERQTVEESPKKPRTSRKKSQAT